MSFNFMAVVIICTDFGAQIKSVTVSIVSPCICHKDGKESTCNAGDLGLIPRVRISSGEGNGSRLQYSSPENSMDRRAWLGTVHGATKSQTQLNNISFFLFLHKEKRVAEDEMVG